MAPEILAMIEGDVREMYIAIVKSEIYTKIFEQIMIRYISVIDSLFLCSFIERPVNRELFEMRKNKKKKNFFF